MRKESLKSNSIYEEGVGIEPPCFSSHIADLFERVDVDHTGEVDVFEVRRMAADVFGRKQLNSASFADLMRELDDHACNENGTMDHSQFTLWWERALAPEEADGHAIDAFKCLEGSKPGRITLKSLREATEATGERIPTPRLMELLASCVRVPLDSTGDDVFVTLNDFIFTQKPPLKKKPKKSKSKKKKKKKRRPSESEKQEVQEEAPVEVSKGEEEEEDNEEVEEDEEAEEAEEEEEEGERGRVGEGGTPPGEERSMEEEAMMRAKQIAKSRDRERLTKRLRSR